MKKKIMFFARAGGGQMSIKKLQPRSLILAYLSENTVWKQQSDRVSKVARAAEVLKE